MSSQTETSAARAWIRSCLTGFYESNRAASAQASEDAFDLAFAPACDVRVNHAPQTLQTLKEEFAVRRATTVHASLEWKGEVISTNEDKPDEPAVVAGAFVVTRTMPWRVRVTPAQRRTHVHFSAKIEPISNVRDGDQRRITSFYYTAVDTTPPVQFAVPPPAAKEGASDGQCGRRGDQTC